MGDEMSITLVQRDIENGNIAPVYLLYGEDRYSIVEALKILKQVFLEQDSSGSGIEYYLGKDISPESIIGAANTAAFFSQRLVIVDDIPYFNQTKNKDDSKPLEDSDEENDARSEERRVG